MDALQDIPSQAALDLVKLLPDKIEGPLLASISSTFEFTSNIGKSNFPMKSFSETGPDPPTNATWHFGHIPWVTNDGSLDLRTTPHHAQTVIG